LYRDIVDFWIFFDNSDRVPDWVAEGGIDLGEIVYNHDKWSLIQENI